MEVVFGEDVWVSKYRVKLKNKTKRYLTRLPQDPAACNENPRDRNIGTSYIYISRY